MKRAIGAIFGITCLSLAPLPAFADSFEDGRAAYKHQDYVAALALWRPLAEQGDPRAQNALGDLYGTGNVRVSQNRDEGYAEAVKWYRKAAEQGFAAAQSSLGRAYYLGYGVHRDPAEAARWRRMAAEQGDADAQIWLGNNYRDGEGVPRDYVLAYMWFDLAAATPVGAAYNASRSRDRLAAKMTPTQIAEGKRLAQIQAQAIRKRGALKALEGLQSRFLTPTSNWAMA